MLASLLQAAVTLLLIVQGSPSADTALRDQAITMANYAIEFAMTHSDSSSAGTKMDIKENDFDDKDVETDYDDADEPSDIVESAVIERIESKANPEGTVVSGEKAYLYGDGLSDNLTIKLGNIEPKYVYVTGISDSRAEFVVPEWEQSAYVSVVVINSSGKNSNFYSVYIDVVEQEPAVIESIESKANPTGTVVSGEKAYIHGSGLSGDLTIKLGNQSPQYVYVTGISDTYAEFLVPAWGYSAYISATVTNSSEEESNFYQLQIVD